MKEEKKKILVMIEEGKISAAEGLELLQALEDGEQKASVVSLKNRFLRVRVYTANSTKVNVNIPMGLLKAASKFAGFGMNFIPEEARNEMAKKGIDLSQIDIGELVKAIEQGLVDEKLVDIDVMDPVEGQVRVEVYVD
ncbi:SHOCT-like domain-containing protein [Candidatus Formimonas warabiya]|uniref:YvlB/LiaX N-terminal domain-containing protein n=1 Tax=Formimonas warabiya TaxID=1761012 RepID=A0A3G1KWS7_FORW1|nr:hypothetical protein [Candidatus Formimonas warabiya]ATW26902.1 hypothetical protein DCMF_20970 [Candidatus Formimonas warabiya]